MSLYFTIRLHQQQEHCYWNPSTKCYKLSYLLWTVNPTSHPNQQTATVQTCKFICMLQIMLTALLRERSSLYWGHSLPIQGSANHSHHSLFLHSLSNYSLSPLPPFICHPFPFIILEFLPVPKSTQADHRRNFPFHTLIRLHRYKTEEMQKLVHSEFNRVFLSQ